MTKTPSLDPVAAHVSSAAALVGLPITASHEPAIVEHFRALMVHADLVTAFPLDVETLVATEFRP